MSDDLLEQLDKALTPPPHKRKKFLTTILAMGVASLAALLPNERSEGYPVDIDTTWTGWEWKHSNGSITGANYNPFLNAITVNNDEHPELAQRVHEATGVPTYVLEVMLDHRFSADSWMKNVEDPGYLLRAGSRELGLNAKARKDNELALTRAATVYRDLEQQVGERKALILYFRPWLKLKDGRIVSPFENHSPVKLEDIYQARLALYKKGEPADE